MKAIFRVLIGLLAVSLSLVFVGPAASARTVALPARAATGVSLTAVDHQSVTCLEAPHRGVGPGTEDAVNGKTGTVSIEQVLQGADSHRGIRRPLPQHRPGADTRHSRISQGSSAGRDRWYGIRSGRCGRSDEHQRKADGQ